MPSKKIDDEFVLTISDNEDLPFSDAESSASEELALTSSKKRKREDVKVNGSKKKQKKALKEEKTVIADEEESEQEERGVQDGTIDPDFEFDLGVDAIEDATENFDGWGDDSKSRKANGDKRAVDIDEIIARRAAKKSAPTVSNVETGIEADGSDLEVDDEERDIEDDGDDSEAEAIDFEDDELLAPDAFGANAPSEDEVGSSQDSDDEADDASASDDGSVASPTAHPDDVASNSDDDSASQASAEDEEETAKRAAFFGTESQQEAATTSTTNSFQQFSLSRPILRALAALSFSSPTPIQTRTIPIALQGLDIVGSAVTGSGKTAAFLLPILERLLYRPRKIPTTRVAILMPTRELAVQCHNVAVALARYTDITFAQVVGGFSLREQEAVLKKRPDVVIATPGRFIDHMRNSVSFAVENLEILVLDEADRMLEDGFADELDEILRTIPKGRQTMLFSATMTENVDKLVRVGMNRPIRVSVDAKRGTVSGLIQEFVRLRPGREDMRLATLCILCTKTFSERTIIFFRQKKEAHRVRIVFGLLGIKSSELHGSMSQEQRISAVNSFREGKTTHLLATDLASRGLDIKNVMSVINYEAPQSHEIYLHRVGRTARAGKTGRSCTIAAEPDRKVVKTAVKTSRAQGAKIVSRTIPSSEVDTMQKQIDSLETEIEAILLEEKTEKALATTESAITRGDNLVKHSTEILSRPRRTWFESEKEKKQAQDRGKAELNSSASSGLKFTGEKKKLSNKDKKRLDDRRERVDGGRAWKKGKGDADSVKVKAKRKDKGKSTKNGGKPLGGQKGSSSNGGGGGGGGGGKAKAKGKPKFKGKK